MLAFDHCSTHLVEDAFRPYHVDDLMFVQCVRRISSSQVVGNTLASSNTTGWVMMSWFLLGQSNCAT